MLCVAAADLISCLEWDPNGELLATGDKGGRVVVFRRERSDHLPVLVCSLHSTPLPSSHSHSPSIAHTSSPSTPPDSLTHSASHASPAPLALTSPHASNLLAALVP